MTTEALMDRLDAASRALSRAGGMAVTTGFFELVTLIGEIGCNLDEIINDLEAESHSTDSAGASHD